MDVPLTPSQVAVIVVGPPIRVPAVTVAVAGPVCVTGTASALLELHVNERPASSRPLESYALAVNVYVRLLRSDTVAGVTRTLATVTTGGGSGTVTEAVPLFPSLVAAITAVPAPVAVTTPVLETVATVGALVAQVIVRPESVVPAESRSVATRAVAVPICRVAVAGARLTDATGAGGGNVTTTCATPVFPSLVASIVVLPAPTAVTRPRLLTVATAVFADDQLTDRPLSTFPFASVVTAESDAERPTSREAEPGETVTAATGMRVTVTDADAALPSHVPVIVALPAVTPVTFPLLSTVATCDALVAHTTDRPVST
jgi:hypothetical protein